LDVNLLTSEFPRALAEALERVHATPATLVRARDVDSLAANL